ncbi:MAG TPA: hypothetical protein VLY45_05360 [Nitrospiria bacterium]|nr:hypothetical protein [Nitrospiria bacterium]
MNHRTLIMPAVILAGLLGASSALAAETSPTEQCPAPEPTSCDKLNAGGSSAATPFMGQVPLFVLDQPNGTTITHYPIEYINGDIAGPPAISHNKLWVWTGTRNGRPTIIRYEATGSSDGYKKLQQPTTNPLSNMTYLDHTGLTGCTLTPGLQGTAPHQYWLYTGCTATYTTYETMGFADVGAKTFHQTSPGLCSGVPCTITVTPFNETGITEHQVVMVPWSIMLGAAVQREVSPGVYQNVKGLSRTEVEAIFSGNVYDWTQLGLVSMNTDGTVNDTYPNAPITLCLRQAGSGSKASFNVTVMKDVGETTSGSVDLTDPTDGGYYFGASTQDVEDCIQGNSGLSRPAHPDAAGYIDADQERLTSAGGGVNIASCGASCPWNGKPSFYAVALNGLLARDTSLTDPQINVKCGQYLYWAGERENTHTGTDPNIDGSASTGPEHDLQTAFINASGSQSVVSLLPAGAYWVPKASMYVSKNSDPGPMLFPGQANPCNTLD